MADLGALMSGVLHMMLGLIWGEIGILTLETKWLTDSMTREDFLEF